VQIDRPANTRDGRRGISGDAALRLRRWFGTGPQFWLDLQSIYESNKARKEGGDESDRLPRLGRERTGELDRVEAE
jgi:plasmid maintenance system antidote protein VapI